MAIEDDDFDPNQLFEVPPDRRLNTDRGEGHIAGHGMGDEAVLQAVLRRDREE